MIRTATSGLFAVGLLGLSTTIAAAAPAVVERDSNFRAAPGTGSQVITVIPAGTMINVMDCQAGWCAASYGPQQGYIAQSLIAFAGASGPYAAAPRVYAPRTYRPRVGPRWYGPGPYAHYRPYYGPRYRYRDRGPGFGFWFGY